MRKQCLALALASCFVAGVATAQRIDTTRIVLCTDEAKAAARSVRLTGELRGGANGDFRQLREQCWQLDTLDMGDARCTALPDNAFHSRHRLRSVVLPRGLREVGSQAFFACDGWQGRLSVPRTVVRIGQSAFAGCAALTEIDLPADSLAGIGPFAFARCTGLRRVRVGAAVPPALAPTAFAGVDLRRVRLEVPRGSERLYREAEGWREFYGKADTAGAASLALIPAPADMQLQAGAAPLRWREVGTVVAAAGLDVERDHLLRVLGERLGGGVPRRRGRASVVLEVDSASLGHEAYRLDVSSEGVRITGGDAAGVFYGIMTLDQLLAQAPADDAETPALHIADRPRTAMRELMVDPARTFIPMATLRDFVAEMARYKYNSLHLHLVDDQAWRVEIKAYPLLTQVASKRVGMDDRRVPIEGFYTQEELRELVAYAARYHVEVVPEIELPGHEVAAVHCYPQLTCGARRVPIRTTCGVSDDLLCPGEEFVYTFLGQVFAELADVFPSRYIHLGGDEAGMPPLGRWTDCGKCRALKRRLGIEGDRREDNWRLQKYMFDRVIDTLRTQYGKTPMFWYETDFREIQPGCVVFAWRYGKTPAAIDAAMENGAKIVLCPGEHCYFDYPMAPGDMPEHNWGMPVTSLHDTYSLDPAWGKGDAFEHTYLHGVAGTLWSECIDSPERMFYQAFPRALALAEVGWSPQAARSWDDFLARLKPIADDMQRRGVSLSLRWK